MLKIAGPDVVTGKKCPNPLVAVDESAGVVLEQLQLLNSPAFHVKMSAPAHPLCSSRTTMSHNQPMGHHFRPAASAHLPPPSPPTPLPLPPSHGRSSLLFDRAGSRDVEIRYLDIYVDRAVQVSIMETLLSKWHRAGVQQDFRC